MTLHESPYEAKLWVIRQIAKFITETEGKGTFREFNDYLDVEYADSYNAGGMTITNAVMPQTAYILYGEHYDDSIFHAIFTSKALLDEYTSKYGIKVGDGYWHCEELRVNPTDGEGL